MTGKRKHTSLLLIAGLLLCSVSFAQYNGQEDLEKAVSFYNDYTKTKTDVTILDSAKLYIERSFKDEGIATTAPANMYYGVIMKEIYKAREGGNFQSPSRKLSVEYFMRALQIDTSSRNRDIVKQQLRWIAGQFNNDAKRALEKNADVMVASENFAEFKKLIVIAEPAFNVKAKEIEFELASGSALQDKAEKTGKKEFYDLAKVSYLKVLDIDSLNNDANYNIGIIYYNQGAFLIMKVLDFDTPIDSVQIIEDMAKKFFLQARPFMSRALSARPNCLKILEGLMGIYYSLNDDENFKKYKDLFEKLKADIEAGRIKEEC
jgi:tetratricopeptide (TPR) repeat protein